MPSLRWWFVYAWRRRLFFAGSQTPSSRANRRWHALVCGACMLRTREIYRRTILICEIFVSVYLKGFKGILKIYICADVKIEVGRGPFHASLFDVGSGWSSHAPAETLARQPSGGEGQTPYAPSTPICNPHVLVSIAIPSTNKCNLGYQVSNIP